MKFTGKISTEIALRSFELVLDCILGYSDSGYDLTMCGEEFEQNFEEDLQEYNITITPYKLKVIASKYDNMRSRFEKQVRNKYYKIK